MAVTETGRLAVLWRGDAEARRNAAPQNNRFYRVFEALSALGIHAEPTVYADDIAGEVREQLLKVDGVLVWVDPIHDGQTRTVLDALLRDVASRAPWVSAHPDVILKMGVKEVLHRTRHLGWGADTHLYRTARAFRQEFPAWLQSAGPRVLKQNRGNGGQGVWKVELLSDSADQRAAVRVLHARRGSVPETMPLADFLGRCEAYFTDDGSIVDQPFQPRLPEGMIRSPPADQGTDPAAARRPGIRSRPARSAHHAFGLGSSFSGAPGQHGIRMDAADDGGARHRRLIVTDHLGCRLSVWLAHRNG
jgi:hypothetical protein